MGFKVKTSELEIFVRSELFKDGRTEDGEAMISEGFYLVAEDKFGNRRAHQFTTTSEYKITRLEEKVKAAEEIDADYWAPIEPRYGSQAYIRDEPFIVAREKEDDLWK